jgi:ubiquinone/menaquinone biosynthesis C-methylase UbiE
MWTWIVGAALAVALLAVFFYWAFFVTEGAYLGARVVAWTYDVTARHYDRIKNFNPIDDAWLLAMPMLRGLDGVDCPLLLDVATGTGRMPYAMLKRPQFRGTVVGLDLSVEMLRQANAKLSAYAGRYALVWHDAQQLPFPDDTFDAVSCLEALEFMPSPRTVLSEMARVLRPGGVLVVTNRVNWERKLMPGKAFPDDRLRQMLQEIGLQEVEIRPWQVYYDLIWARKAGTQSRLGRGTQGIEDLLRCDRCQHAPLEQRGDALYCPSCGQSYVFREHIVYADARAHKN